MKKPHLDNIGETPILDAVKAYKAYRARLVFI